MSSRWTRYVRQPVEQAFRLTFLLGAATAASAADLPDYPFIFAVGKADIDTPPNMASCSLTIRARETDAGKAVATVEQRIATVLKTLSANKVAPKDIESASVQKAAITDERYDGLKQVNILGYDVSRRVKFVVRQLEAIAPIETTMVRAPNITDFDCQFDRTDHATVESDLQTKALLSAREQADKMAAPLGRHVVAAVAISKIEFGSIPAAFGIGDNGAIALERMDRMFKRSVGDELRGDELLVPATIHMTTSVNVLFKME